MTQTPPVSPDFAAMARELVEKRRLTLTYDDWLAAVSKELASIHAAGRAEGLAEAARRSREIAGGYTQSSDGRNTFLMLAEWCEDRADCALASDPVAGDQHGLHNSPAVLAIDGIGVVPAPAPGLPAQEVERLREALGELMQIEGGPENVADAQVLAARVRAFARAALSAPRPAQAKEGPTE